MKFSDDNYTISYKEQKYYIFNSTYGSSEDDSIYFLNLPAIIISKLLEEYLPEFALNIVGLLLKQERLFEKRTIKEILWGYNSSLAIEINNILKRLHLPIIKFPEFGLYVGKRSNGSISETFNISTGVSDIKGLGKIYSWDGKNELPFWSGNNCNKINGTDGTFWPPFIDQSLPLFAYSPDICRSIYLLYDSKQKVLGTNVYKFNVPPSAFQDFKNKSELQCFCVPDIKSCLKRGVLDVSACNAGAPIIISMPHFMYSDQEYIDEIHGLHPTTLKHETFISVEPHIGMALEAHKRLQVNILLRNYKAFPATKNIKNYVVFPMAWADEHGMLSPEDAEELYTQLYKPLMMAQFIQYGLIAFGYLCLLSIIVVLLVKALQLFKCIRTEESTPDEITPLLSGNHSID